MICEVIFANIKTSNWQVYILPSINSASPLCFSPVTWGLRYFRAVWVTIYHCRYSLPWHGREFLLTKVYHVKSLTIIITVQRQDLDSFFHLNLLSSLSSPLYFYNFLALCLMKTFLVLNVWREGWRFIPIWIPILSRSKLSLITLTFLFCCWSSKLVTNVHWERHHPIG